MTAGSNSESDFEIIAFAYSESILIILTIVRSESQAFITA